MCCVVAGAHSSDTAEGSQLLASVGHSLSGTSAETRQLLRRLSARVSTRLLHGYRSLSMGSDDVERHEYGAPFSTYHLAHGLENDETALKEGVEEQSCNVLQTA